MLFKLVRTTTLILLFIILLDAWSDKMVIYAQAEPEPESLARRHCIGLGDLDSDPDTPSILDPDAPEFCGCTWGNIYYRGQLIGAVDQVSLSFDGESEIGTTHVPTGTGTIEPPFYNVSGFDLGAVRNDIMTISIEFDGHTLERSFRALPENGEQQISFALPEYGQWVSVISGDYNNAIAIDGDSVYAGGTGGLIVTNLVTNESRELLLPWQSQIVGRIATGSNGEIWASSTAGDLARFDGTSWMPVEIPFAGTIRALHVDPASSTLWVGMASGNSGRIATYDGTWTTVEEFSTAPVTTLTQDANGMMWAGTWGDGVYHQQADGTWTHYSVDDGMASRHVLSAATGNDAQGDDADSVWFGTDPTGSSISTALGGVSVFGLDGANRGRFGIGSGLPADVTHTASPAQIKSIAVDGNGKAWIIVNDTLYWFHVQSSSWIAHTTEAGAQKLTLNDANILLTNADGVQHFDRTSQDILGTKPVVSTITAPSGSNFVSGEDLVILQASATDADDQSDAGSDSSIVAWEWLSSIDGPLCTTSSACSVAAHRLSIGSHEVSLRVQDDEGVWSEPTTTEITISDDSSPPSFRLFIPTIQQ